jgi:outer membrane protein OmpA-like peptidoglycan-associated protein
VRFVQSSLLLIPVLASAQPTLPAEREILGISARLLWASTIHSPNFSMLPGTVDCGTYISGRGSGIGAALTLEYPLGRSVAIGLAAAFLPRGGKLQTPTDREPAFDNTSGQVFDVVTENTLDVQLDYLECAPTLWWSPISFGRSSIRFDAGLRLGIPLRGRFQQTRHIVSPENAVFMSNQQRTINWTNGYVPLDNLQRPTVGISVGAEHLLPIGTHLHLLQRIGYDYTFTPPVRSLQWSISGIRLELGVRLWFERSRELPPPPPPPSPSPLPDTSKPSIPVPTPLPVPTLAARISGFDGYVAEGTELVATTPLVSAVFFEQNSSVIPSRYALRSSDSIPTSDPVTAHRNVLLVVADILRRNPQSTVVLDGATSGDYETADTLLARRRAEAVAAALGSLGITPNRIRTRWARLPRVPSNMDYPEGRAENQRVDITLTGAPILEYVSNQTFSELRGTLSVQVRGDNIEGSRINLLATGSDERTIADTGTFSLPVLLRLEAGTNEVLLRADARLEGTELSASDSLRVQIEAIPRRRVELSTERFEAILRFDYNSSTLSTENKELLRQLIERLPDGTTIEIGGSADVLGDVARNRRLAEERAHVTEEFLRSLTGIKQFQIVARGIERRFSDATPEGRFLNRSIRVRLR